MMWRRLKNFVLSVETYSDLSPDGRRREQINHQLAHRPSYEFDDWFTGFWQSAGIQRSVAAFVYQRFAHYSGLTFAKIRPEDQLEVDLSWTQVCWFDWELALFDDFYTAFALDISDRFDYDSLVTVADAVEFLNDQVLRHPLD